jgi:BASS family bile acid:Na+ symporter
MTSHVLAAVPFLTMAIVAIVGLDLRFGDFRRVRHYPRLVPVLVAAQWAVPLLVAGAFARLLDLPYPVAGGLILIASAPAAALTAYYAKVARGNLPLAVTLLAVSNALAFVVTPLVATTGYAWLLGSGAELALPVAKVAQQAVVGILLPLLAGMLLRHLAPVWATRWRGRFEALGFAAIVMVLGVVGFDQFATIRQQVHLLFGVAAGYTIATVGLGAVTGALAARAKGDRDAATWGFPARNVAVAALLATATVDAAGIAAFLAVLFTTQVALLFAVSVWKRTRVGGVYAAPNLPEP